MSTRDVRKLEINTVVAENAKRLREEKRLTLDEAARLTGVSRSMLAQIEKGDVNPTISMVWKIANGYRVSFTSLVEPARHRCPEIWRRWEKWASPGSCARSMLSASGWPRCAVWALANA